jgi:hypothetical protein
MSQDTVGGSGFPGKATAPVSNAFAITPSNTVDLETVTRGLYVGTAGDVKVDLFESGTAITFKNLSAGVIHPLRVKRVYSTGTSALDILGVY